MQLLYRINWNRCIIHKFVSMCIGTWRRLFVLSTFQQKCLIKFVSAAFPTVINLWNINDASSLECKKSLVLIIVQITWCTQNFISSLFDRYKLVFEAVRNLVESWHSAFLLAIVLMIGFSVMTCGKGMSVLYEQYELYYVYPRKVYDLLINLRNLNKFHYCFELVTLWKAQYMRACAC